MPRLPTAADLGARPTLPGQPYSLPRGSNGAVAAEAIQYAGKKLQGLGADLEQAREIEQDRADTLRAEDSYNRLGQKVLDLTDGENGYSHIKGTAVLGRDVRGEYLGQFDETVKQIESGLANDQQRGKLKQRADFARLQFQRDLLNHIGRQGEVAAKEVYDNSTQLETRNAASHWQEPMAIGVSLTRLGGLVSQEADRSGWSPEKKAFELMRVTSEANAGVVESALAADDLPYAEAHFKRVQKELDPETAARIQRALKGKRREMEAEARQQQALARVDVLEREADEKEAYLATGNFQGNNLTRAEYVAAWGPEEGVKRYDTLQKYVKAGGIVQELALADQQKRAEILAVNKPEPKEGFAENQQVYSIIQRADAQMQKAREEDPAAYATRYLPNVGRAYQELLANPADPMAAEDYVRQVQAASDDLGIQNRDVLPKEMANSIVQRLKDQPSGKPAAQMISAERERWGSSWPWVWKQISTQVPDHLFNVAEYAGRSSPQDQRDVSALLDRGYELTSHVDGQPPAFNLKAGQDGKTGLEEAFNTFVGDAFIGDATGRQRALSGVTAAYAAYAEGRPDGLTGMFDGNTFALAAKAYFGTTGRGAIRMNGGSVLAPYGMDEADFTAGLQADAAAKLKDRLTPDQVTAIVQHAVPQKFGDGYLLRTGDAYVPGPDKRPMVFYPIEVPRDSRPFRAAPFDPTSPLVTP